RAVGRHQVGDETGAGDRVAARVHQRNPHRGVPFDHRLDFLRMYLEAAHVDDTAAPADEIITAVAQLHHVVGVDEAVGAGERQVAVAEGVTGGSGRGDAQRAVLDLELRAVAGGRDGARRYAFACVGH